MPLSSYLKRSDSILLDTHVVLWLFEDSEQLSHSVSDDIERARSDEKLFISAISFWELAILHRKGRIRLKTDFKKWVQVISNQAGVQIVSVTLPLLMNAVEIDGLGYHLDPADLMIAASAIEHEAVLLTRDEALLEGARKGRYRAFEV
jgi:PIN domain nuclease of toxin-antitoxin system